jgi:hypothetical protein
LPKTPRLVLTFYPRFDDSRGSSCFDGSEGGSTPERTGNKFCCARTVFIILEDKEDLSSSTSRAYNSDSFDEKWEQRYIELGDYLKKHGHFSMERSPLERWVHRQRSEYKSKKLSQYRIRKLESIGMKN